MMLIVLLSFLLLSKTLGLALAPTPSQQGALAETRDIQGLDSWANQQGILRENGFELLEQNDSRSGGGGDWSAQLRQSQSTGGARKEGMRVMQVPSHLIFSSQRIRQEFENAKVDLTEALELLERKKCALQTPQFYIFLKLLQEWELGPTSQWYPYLQSLPRSYMTAATMDEVELECLPPFAWSLAQLFRIHCTSFIEALALVPNTLLTEETKGNTELAQWTFNTVLTRCWGQDGGDNNETRCDVVPMADMFNHGDPANVVIYYDENENCNVLLKHQEKEEDGVTLSATLIPLRLSYGKATNPSRFLSIFGFVDESQPTIFCQVLVHDPSDRHVQMGYDTSKMVFSTTDGSIADEVWDVILFSILEQAPALQNAFYQAHVDGTNEVKATMHQKFRLESAIVLKKHVDGTLQELGKLLHSMDGLDFDKHARLPMIQKHNQFVHQVFSYTKTQLDEQIKAEVLKRREHKL
jgi:hypothetical protein